MTIRAVWTDFGGVLTPPIEHTMLAFCRRHRLEPAAVQAAVAAVSARYGTDDIMLPLDTPLVTEQQWLREVGDELGMAEAPLTMADSWFDGRETNHAWLERLIALRASGVFVGLLSNMVPTWDEHWRRMVAPAHFDDIVLSFQVGTRKPSRQIFELALQRSGTRPDETVFVDDIARNCAGARAVGLAAIHFTDTTAAIAELDALLAPAALAHQEELIT
jgi:putative hydrolase of the HAD superfamily